MDHAFQCLTACRRCKGAGKVGLKNRRRRCKTCRGRGACLQEFRSIHQPPRFPCLHKTCCICSGDRCEEEWCPECHSDGECHGGACPACGGHYVEWFSFDVEPEDVYLNYELWGARPNPGTISVKRL